MFPVLLDKDITLDIFKIADANELFKTVEQHREYLHRWLPWTDTTKTLGDCTRFLQVAVEEYIKNESITLGIWHQDKLIGAMSLRDYDWTHSSANLGYWIIETYQGKGIITAASRAMVAYAFSVQHFKVVTITCAIHNIKSQAIPKRLGFTVDKILPNEIWLYDHFIDAVVFKLTNDKWNSTKG